MERLDLDYSETTQLARQLVDVRFKLLALVPTISGGAVALVSRSPTPGQLLAVGLLGLTATVGIALYELDNTRTYEYALRRAARLEGEHGLYRGRPGERLSAAGLPLVYGAALGGWAYLFGWGALRALDVGHAQRVGGAFGVIAAGATVFALAAAGGREAAQRRPPVAAQPESPNA
jgi:hypothetical protein